VAAQDGWLWERAKPLRKFPTSRNAMRGSACPSRGVMAHLELPRRGAQGLLTATIHIPPMAGKAIEMLAKGIRTGTQAPAASPYRSHLWARWLRVNQGPAAIRSRNCIWKAARCRTSPPQTCVLEGKNEKRFEFDLIDRGEEMSVNTACCEKSCGNNFNVSYKLSELM
jgi:hypothetical protein